MGEFQNPQQQPQGQGDGRQPWGMPQPGTEQYVTSPMGFVEAIKTCFTKYADFNG